MSILFKQYKLKVQMINQRGTVSVGGERDVEVRRQRKTNDKGIKKLTHTHLRLKTNYT